MHEHEIRLLGKEAAWFKVWSADFS